MDDEPEGLTPPGPPVEPEGPEPGPSGGVSMDDWIAAQRDRPAPALGPTAYHPIAAYGAPQPWRELDQTSVVGFALALTGIAAPVGFVLGIRGLKHTADGTKAGRWAAILAVVLGLVATLVIVAGTIGLTWFRDNVKGISRVEAGECANLDDSDGLTFFPKACTDRHQVEVVAAGDFDDAASLRFTNVSAADFCFHSVDDHYRQAARTGDYQVRLVIDGNGRAGPELGDHYACFYLPADGSVLTDPIGEDGDDS